MKKVFLILLGIGIGLFLTEFTLRIISYVVHNHIGNYEIEKKYYDYVILCIGDSVTYGVGDEKNGGYPVKLERLLNEKFLDKKIKVINKAIPGATTLDVLKQIELALEAYPRIDLVLALTGCGNDSWNLKSIYKEIRPYLRLEDRITYFLDSILRNLKLYKLVKLNFYSEKYKHVGVVNKECSVCLDEVMTYRSEKCNNLVCEPDYFNKCVYMYKDCIKKFPKCREAYLQLLGIYLLCQQENNLRKIDEIFLKFPELYSLVKRTDIILSIMWKNTNEIISLCKNNDMKLILLQYPSNEQVIPIKSLAKKRKVFFLDLGKYFKEELNCDVCRRYFVDNIHLNREGYFLMAKKISEYVAKVLRYR